MPPKYSKELKINVVAGYLPQRQHRTSPCEANCPAGNRIQAMQTLIREGHGEEAHALLLAKNPFPGITGRVCPHPCEGKCNRTHYDEGVSIRALERFAADQPDSVRLKAAEPSGKRVAIIGAGPAGLTCAYFLTLLGHAVSIFDASPVLGGTPRTAVPDFRLPKNIADRETGRILGLGMAAYTNTKIGRDISILDLRSSFDACVVATGNMLERRLAIEGGEKALSALSFLTGSSLDRQTLTEKNVAILGGGGVAFDCAFTAKRLGASAVHLVFPEAECEIKVPPEELEQARREGLELHPSRLSVRIDDSGVSALRLESFCFDAGGNLKAQTVEDDVLRLDADLVVCASGLMPDLSFLDPLEAPKSPRGHLLVDEHMQTGIPGLFAAGDIAHGPGSVANAIGSGRRAALGVHACLAGVTYEPLVEMRRDADGFSRLVVTGESAPGQPRVVEFSDISNPCYHEKAPRHHAGTVAEAIAGTEAAGKLAFAEIAPGFDAETARAEAERCMHCGHCIDCGTCVERCPNYILERDEENGPRVAYPDECWHCACCRIGCPTGSISIEFPITMLV